MPTAATITVPLALAMLLPTVAADAPAPVPEPVPVYSTAPTALVVYVGNDPTALTQFEQWLGCPVDGVAVHSGQASWDDWSGSIGYELNLWSTSGRALYWSVPLIPTGATLADAAAGSYDDRYRQAAQTIAAGTAGTGPIPIRTGWEFNTANMPWAAAGQEATFAGAFQHFVTAFRSVSSRFTFEWAPNIGGQDPVPSYPGDAFVDVIGMDAYYDTQFDPLNAWLAWQKAVTENYGLKWLQDFAAAHRKPTAYGEWGVMSPGAAPYVLAAAAWYAHYRPVYQAYWNSDSAFPGKLSDDHLPGPGFAFRKAFARCAAPAAPAARH